MTELDITANIKQLGKLVEKAKTVLILQPERPDTDSLCSSLVLEQILGDLGKEPVMYCQDEVPGYISYFEGADRVTDKLPNQFDFVILVDCGGPQQVARTLEKYQGRLTAKPFVIIDHHATRTPMPFGTIDVIDPLSASTGELLVRIAGQLGWKLNGTAASLVVPSIMADTRGLTVPTTTANTVQTVAEMVRLGANLYLINQARIESGALDQELVHLRGRLLQDVEYLLDGRLALITIEPGTLKDYAKKHDPADLVMYEMQNTRGVVVAIAIRNYSPKIKLSLRANGPVAAPIAAEFGGGGHPQASGATIEAGKVDEVRAKVIAVTETILADALIKHAN